MGLLKLAGYAALAAGIFYGGMAYKQDKLEPKINSMEARIETMATTEYQMLDLARKQMNHPESFKKEISSIDQLMENETALKERLTKYGLNDSD